MLTPAFHEISSNKNSPSVKGVNGGEMGATGAIQLDDATKGDALQPSSSLKVSRGDESGLTSGLVKIAINVKLSAMVEGIGSARGRILIGVGIVDVVDIYERNEKNGDIED